MKTSDSQFIPVITIDGSSGSGKGTIARLVAIELKWHYLDSGSLYRALAWAMLRHQFDLEQVDQLTEFVKNLSIRFETTADASRLICEGEDISDAIRTESCGAMASKIASRVEVRDALMQLQRDFRQSPGLVTDGRDMGSVVFPDAPLKFFFTASLEERAGRRYRQLKDMGIDVSLREIQEDLKLRDERDRNRSIAPLKATDDMVIIDTAGLTVTEVFTKVMEVVRSSFKGLLPA